MGVCGVSRALADARRGTIPEGEAPAYRQARENRPRSTLWADRLFPISLKSVNVRDIAITC